MSFSSPPIPILPTSMQTRHKHKCFNNSCSNEGLPCGARKCNKYVCRNCYLLLAKLKWKVEPLEGQVFHTKDCLGKGKTRLRLIAKGGLPWLEDGPNGSDDAINSLSVLIKWLQTDGNYKMLKGEVTDRGRTKKSICEEIGEEMKKAGCVCTRSPGAIMDKIKYLEIEYRKAKNWIKTNGRGHEGTNKFYESVRKFWPYYFELQPVFEKQDRVSSHQPVNGSDEVPVYGSFSAVQAKQYTEITSRKTSMQENVFDTKYVLGRAKSRSRPIAKSGMQWKEDGPNGPDDPNNSLSVLIKWLQTDGNYTMYKGEGGERVRTKHSICQEIGEEIKKAGCICTRTPKAVMDKIRMFELEYRKAKTWIRTNGQGIEGTDKFYESVRKVCPNYFELQPVFEKKDRASSLQAPQRAAKKRRVDGSDDVPVSGSFSELQDKPCTEVMRRHTTMDGSDDVADSVSEVQDKQYTGIARHDARIDGSDDRAGSLSEVQDRQSTEIARHDTRIDGSDDIAGSLSEVQDKQYTEIARHDTRMEEIEGGNFHIEERKEVAEEENPGKWDENERMKWATLKEKLSYEMQEYESYQRLKTTLSKKRIRKIFPGMVKYFSDDETEDNDDCQISYEVCTI